MECQNSCNNTNHLKSSLLTLQNCKRYVKGLGMRTLKSLLEKIYILGAAKVVGRTLDT